jgi:hypothetical protein
MSLTGLGTENHCADEGQQQFSSQSVCSWTVSYDSSNLLLLNVGYKHYNPIKSRKEATWEIQEYVEVIVSINIIERGHEDVHLNHLTHRGVKRLAFSLISR